MQTDIKYSAEELGWWHRRLRDSGNYKIKYSGSSSPFDELLWNGEFFIGIECKLINNKAQSKSFPFNRVSNVQREGLLSITDYKNTLSFVVINFRWIDHQKGKCFAIPINDFIKLEKEIDRKSIPLDYFKNETIELKRLGKGWDLRLLIN